MERDTYTLNNHFYHVDTDSIYYVESMTIDRWTYLGSYVTDDFGNLKRTQIAPHGTSIFVVEWY